jgi:hypothetical protein
LPGPIREQKEIEITTETYNLSPLLFDLELEDPSVDDVEKEDEEEEDEEEEEEEEFEEWKRPFYIYSYVEVNRNKEYAT